MDEFGGLPVESKLHAPDLREEWVPRRQLVRDLTATRAKLILVQAPAGFGKTTTTAQWRDAELETRPFAWVSLDRGDDDPARLWWHVVSALQRACPALGEDFLRSFRARIPDITGSLLPALVNTLSVLAEPVVLVLDDYHLLTEQRCHEEIEFLLLNLLAPAKIVLITRASPPLQLARLRAAGDMTEIGMRELRFTHDEVAELVDAVAGVRLGDGCRADLAERTEGWPAGVYLAALSLRGHAVPGAFIRQFTGDNRYVADFLFEEVISRQPEDILLFLTRTSILDRFTAPLCEAVTETAGAAEIIDVLERENLFLVALDENRQWFRYHHLFEQVLRSRLMLRERALVPTLHRRASAWHRLHGSAPEAIDHALAGGDVASAVDLMAGHWSLQVSAGRIETVRGWISALGDEVVSTKPLAAHSAAWVAAISGELGTVRRLVRVIEAAEHAGPLPDGMPSLEFSAALLHAAFGFDGVRVMRESAARAVELDRNPTSPWRTLALTALGFSLYLSGEPGAVAAVGRAVQVEASPPLVRLAALSAAALLAADEGRLGQAEALANAARHIAESNGMRESPQSSIAHAAAAVVQAQEGRLEDARGELERALLSRQHWLGLSPWPTVEILFRLASVLLDMGDGTRAGVVLAEAAEVLTALPDGTDALRVRLELLRQRLSGASGAPAPAQSLTERERTVLRLLRGSLSLAEIAQELGMSSNTIKTHTRAIYRKLGVSDRYGAVARARELRLL
jgi:LuxR family transcriptional regulator, maltose regulon positive regulatory protein